jgi:hypothetical protein
MPQPLRNVPLAESEILQGLVRTSLSLATRPNGRIRRHKEPGAARLGAFAIWR